MALDEAMGNYNDDKKHDDSSTLADTAEKMVEGANKENENWSWTQKMAD